MDNKRHFLSAQRFLLSKCCNQMLSLGKTASRSDDTLLVGFYWSNLTVDNIFELPIIAPLTAESLMMSYC
jgi:hypothetical protein